MGYMDTQFWPQVNKATPGLFDMGINAVANRGLRREGQNELNTAEGPDYQMPMGASRDALSRAGSLDPRASGADWLRDQRGLLAPGDSADEAGLMRMLNRTGMLGASSFGVQGPGAADVSQNPLAAAYYAQRANRDQRMGAEALDRGETAIDRQLGRSARLQSQAQGARTSTLGARGTVPSKAVGNKELLTGAGRILKDSGVLKDAGNWATGMLGNVGNWAKGLFDRGDGGAFYSGGQGLDSVMNQYSNNWWESV